MRNNDNRLLKLKITLKLWKQDGTVKRWHSTKSKRIYAILKAEKFRKAYLKVSYGKQKDNHGEMVSFYNDGEYDDKNDLRLTVKAFTEDYKTDTTETIVNPARN